MPEQFAISFAVTVPMKLRKQMVVKTKSFTKKEPAPQINFVKEIDENCKSKRKRYHDCIIRWAFKRPFYLIYLERRKYMHKRPCSD